MSERAINFVNVFNFRDLGGLLGHDGRPVLPGRLFRADLLSYLDSADQQCFAGLGIRTVVDLRRPNEVAEEGRIPAFGEFNYRHVHLVHEVWPPAEFADSMDRARYLAQRYREMTDQATAGFAEALRMIADANHAPLVFHCIAGKDRTGVLAALTLNLLGVSDADVAVDFALSEAAEEPAWRRRHRDNPERLAQRWTHFEVCPAEGILLFLDELRARHGSVEGYVYAIGVTPSEVAAMRAHLLAS